MTTARFALILLVVPFTVILLQPVPVAGIPASEYDPFEPYNRFQIQPVGVRALGMGGAQIAAANDAAAIWHNPARLRAVRDNHVLVAYGSSRKDYDTPNPPLHPHADDGGVFTAPEYPYDNGFSGGGQLAIAWNYADGPLAWSASLFDPYEESFYDGEPHFSTIFFGVGLAFTPVEALDAGVSFAFGGDGNYLTGGVSWQAPELVSDLDLTLGTVGRVFVPDYSERLVSDLPSTFGVGLAASWQGFTLSGDLEHYLFEGIRGEMSNPREDPDGAPYPTTYPLSAAGDITEYRVGVEQRISNGPVFLALRGGFAWKTLLQMDEYNGNPIQEDEWMLGLGVGHKHLSLQIAASWFEYDRWRSGGTSHGFYHEQVRVRSIRVGLQML